MVRKDRFDCEYSAGHFIEGVANVFHFHDDVEMYFHIQGGKHCLVNDTVFDIQPGDLLLLPSNVIHQIVREPSTRYERHVVLAKPGFLTSFQEGNELMSCFADIDAQRRYLLSPTAVQRKSLSQALQEYYQLEKTGTLRTCRRVKCMELICLITQMYLEAGDGGTVRHSNPKISEILAFIDRHYTDEALCLDTIAEACYLNKSYLCGLFRRYTGMTVMQYATLKRLTHAKELLAIGRTVTQAWEESGFGDYSNFIRVFRRYIGITPKQYQQRTQ